MAEHKIIEGAYAEDTVTVTDAQDGGMIFLTVVTKEYGETAEFAEIKLDWEARQALIAALQSL